MTYVFKNSLLAALWVEMGWEQECKQGDHTAASTGEQWIKVVKENNGRSG